MGSRWRGIVVDSRDPGRLARWWAEVLGYRIVLEEPSEVGIAAGDEAQPRITFVPVPDVKSGKNRLHLDLAADDHAAEVERLVDMGARHVDVGHGDEVPWVVLADPEGNEFCVLADAKPATDPADTLDE